jgi:hypothetical protein
MLSQGNGKERKTLNRLRIIIFLGTFAVLWVVLGGITKRVYDQLLPGVPDSGRWPIASLPWLLARANAPGRPWNDLHHAAVWVLAVATLLVPILTVTILARTTIERLMAWIISVILAAWALYTTFDIQYGYLMLFDDWPATKARAVWFVLEPMLWALAICALGAVLGKLIRKAIDASKAAKATSQ